MVFCFATRCVKREAMELPKMVMTKAKRAIHYFSQKDKHKMSKGEKVG